MFETHHIFHQGLFPFVPAEIPYAGTANNFNKEYIPEELWFYPEEDEWPIIKSAVGPGTAFPILLTKHQLAWFWFKVKTWSVTGSFSYNGASGSFDFVTGRNLDSAGEVVEALNTEKSLLFRDSYPLIPLGSETIQYTQVIDGEEYEKSATLGLSSGSAVLLQDELYWPEYAWTPSEDAITHFGPWMKQDHLIASRCFLYFANDIAQGITGGDIEALPDEFGQFPVGPNFGENPETMCEVRVEAPWETIVFPLYRNSGEESITLSDITLTPTEFWEYQPPA